MYLRGLVRVLSCCLSFLALVGCDDKAPNERPTESPPSPAAEAEATAGAASKEVTEEAPPGPSNTAKRSFEQLWSTPTGQATAQVAAVRDGRIYALAGPFMEFGVPASSLVCLALDSGEVLWTHSGDETLSLDGASDKLLDVSTIEGSAKILSAETGKATKPKKAESDATTPVSRPAAQGCTSEGAKLSCAGWSVEEGGAISAVASFEGLVCYALAGAREVRCRATDSGDLDMAVAVPAVPKVKDPEAVNFSFHLVGDALVVGNYDGSVLAFAPAADE